MGNGQLTTDNSDKGVFHGISSLRTGLLTCSVCLLLIGANTLAWRNEAARRIRAPPPPAEASQPREDRRVRARPLRGAGER